MADDLIGDFQRFRAGDDQDRAHGHLLAARKEDPEKAAKVRALAARWGIGLEAARAQQEPLEAQARTVQDNETLTDAPAVAGWLAKNFGNAAVAHDHIADLAKVEQIAKRGMPLFQGPQARAEQMLTVPKGAAILRAPRGLAPTAQNYVGSLGRNFLRDWALLREGVMGAAADLVGADALSQTAQRNTGQLRFEKELDAPEFKTRLAGSVYGGVASTLNAIPAVAGSVATRNPAVGLSVMGGQSGFTAYGKYRERGGTAGEAALGGTLEGTIEAATEAIPMGVLVKQLGRAGLKQFLAKFVGAELPTEQLATFAQDAVDTAIANPDKTWGDFWRERPDAAFDTLVATAVMSAGFGAGHVALQRFARQEVEAERVPERIEAFNELVKAANALPLRERAPDAFEALVQDLTPGIDVHVNAEALTTYLQSVEPDEAQAFIDATGIGDQLNAATPEADIVIPAAKYLQHVAPTPAHEAFQQDLRLGPGAMTPREAEEHKGNRDALLNEAAARALGKGFEISQIEDPAERVRQHFYEQAVAVGVPEEQAKANAAVQAAYYAQRAARNTSYADAWEAYQEANISMKGQGVETQGPRGPIGTGGSAFDFAQPPTPDAQGLLTLSHWSEKGRIKQLDPDKWGENWEVLPDDEKTRVGEAPGRVYWGIGTGQPGEYQPEFGIGPHRYETKVPFERLYGIDEDPQGLREKARVEVMEQAGEDFTESELAPEITSRFEALIKDAGFLGYWSDNPELGRVAATFEPLKHTYKGRVYAQAMEPGEPLIGLPRRIKVDGVTHTFGPHQPARDAAEAYMRKAGLPYDPPREYVQVDEERARRIAAAYDAMPHDPQNPKVRAAYDAMIAETLAQWQEIKATGLVVEFNPPGEDPYGNPRNAILDVVENNHLWVFPTSEGFGSSDLDVADNPLLAVVEGEFISGRPVQVNDIFRIVHDYFGHIKEGVGFRADGEENAWRSHSAMYSPLARRAMTTETRGQNSWVNYGPNAEANKTASGADTVYADQKIGLLPEWVSEEGATDPVDPNNVVVHHGTLANFEGLPTRGMFVQNEQTARNYAGDKGKVHSFYFRPKNPANREQADALDRDPARLAAAGYDGAVWENAAFGMTGIIVDPAAVVPVGLRQGPRGQVTLTDQGAMIELFKSRNASTLIHEGAGHIWLENLARDAADPNASDEVRQDFEIVKSWWRANIEQAKGESKDVSEKRLLKAIDSMGKGDIEAIRPFHEMFARAAEQYFMEGKSPNPELRNVFARFRQWLVGIYREFTKLRVPMTDEMRGVFDRLIAVPQALEDAAVDQSLTPFFPDAQTAGMTPAEYGAYINAIQIADDTAHDRLLGKVMSDIRRKRTAAWKAERGALVEEYQGVVNADSEMRALSLLEDGTVRLQREAVEAILTRRGKAEGDLYRRSRPYVFDVGLHPDAVAEQVGLGSGEELVDALLAMKEEHDALRDAGDKRTVRTARAEALADAEMVSRHGDILNDGTIGDEAMAALHDIRRSEVMIAEVRALVRKAGAVTTIWTEEEMQAWARRQLAARQLDGIRPHIYQMAEAKAGRDALRALVKDDFTAALDAKFRQLLNMHLYRQAREMRESIEKGKALFTRVVQARNGTIAKSRNMDMVEAARAILAPYGFGSTRNDADYMAKVRQYDPEFWADIEPTVTAALAAARPVDELSFDEFESLRTTVDQLWRMSRASRQMQVDFETLELGDVADDLKARLGNVAPRPNDHAPTPGEHAMRLLTGVRAALRRVESWATSLDGGPKGPWRTYVWNPVSDGAARYRNAKADYLRRFITLMEPIQESMRRGKIAAPELNYTFGFANSGVGKGELLHALLHTGNDSNKRKLLLGRGWAVENVDGTLDTTTWDRFLDRMHREGVLTQADWDFAQSVWDLLEEMKPDAQRTHRAVFGRYFEEVTANEVATPFGKYRGGYIPAIVDTFLVQEQALNAQSEAIESGNDAAMFPSPARGFTKSRVEYNRPLALDLGLLPAHIDKVLKFTHMTVPVRDVLRLLKEKGLASTLEAYDPVAVPDLLLPWLNRAAKQVIETPSRGAAGKAADNFFRAVRARTGMGIMIANVSNTVQQLTGWLPATLKVRKRHLVRGLWNVTRNPARVAEDIAAMSPYMATRITAQAHEAQQQMEQLLLDPTKYERVSAFAQKHAYVLQSMTQNLVDMVTWQGAFEQAVERGEDYAEAVRSADSVIRETQGSLAPEDVSRFETGSPFVRVFTQFYNYFGAQSNLLLTEFGNARTMTRVGYVYIAGMMLPAIISDIIRRSFGEGWSDDDDDGYLDTFLDTFFGSQFRYVTGMVPILGPMIVNAANQLNDKPYDDDIVPAPAFSSAQQIGSVPRDVYKLVTEGEGQKRTIRDTATLLTLLTGVPWFNAAARPAGYLADINEGKVEPTSNLDLARGLMTGTASAESRVQ